MVLLLAPRTVTIARSAYAGAWALYCFADRPKWRREVRHLLYALRPFTTNAQNAQQHTQEFNRWAATLPGYTAHVEAEKRKRG